MATRPKPVRLLLPLLLLAAVACNNPSHALQIYFGSIVLDRRGFLRSCGIVTASSVSSASGNSFSEEPSVPERVPFRYTESWSGTCMALTDLEQAAAAQTPTSHYWEMGRWPDPLLRRPADPVDPKWFGTSTLATNCDLLAATARANKAVGLAAQQCGVNARIIFLQRPGIAGDITMINPQIVQRSPETSVRVWQEHCLVLPPSFVATVLRDEWIVAEYQDPSTGDWRRLRLSGEMARAAQHEMDHDRGILVTDHVDLEELENDTMRSIERIGHMDRMLLAYDRDIKESNCVES